MSTTLPVPNQQSPLVDTKTGKIVSPWNNWFQQFSQKAPTIVAVTQSPFTANANGTLIITGTTIILTRGSTAINLGTGQRIIPISIGDTISWTGAATAQFLGA